jgi:hypothetical protein
VLPLPASKPVLGAGEGPSTGATIFKMVGVDDVGGCCETLKLEGCDGAYLNLSRRVTSLTIEGRLA